MAKVDGLVGVDNRGTISVDAELGMVDTFVIVCSDRCQLPDERSDEVDIRCELVLVRSCLNCQALSHDGEHVAVRSIVFVVGEESSVTVWLHPEDVGVAWVEDESLHGQVAVASVEPQSSVVDGVWVGGVLVLAVASVDLDVPGVLVPLVGVRPFDVLCRVLAFEQEVGDDATGSLALSESSLEEASGADVVAAVKLGNEHVVLFARDTSSVALALLAMLLAVTT